MENIKLPKAYQPGDEDLPNIIAPAGLEVGSNYLKIGDYYTKTIFIFTYPRFVTSGWFSSIINLPAMIDISIFMHPMDTALALRNLRKKVAQIEAEINEKESKGIVRDPILETAHDDVETLRDALQQARERLFEVGVYITLYAPTEDDLKTLEETVVNTLESKLVKAKPANSAEDEWVEF